MFSEMYFIIFKIFLRSLSRSYHAIPKRTHKFILKDIEVSCTIKHVNALLNVSRISWLVVTFQVTWNTCLFKSRLRVTFMSGDA